MNRAMAGVARTPEAEPAAVGSDLPELVAAAGEVLQQGLNLLSRLDDEKYSRIARDPFNASVGGHYRHVLEHFQCLIEGMSQRVVNYDARRRNPRIENEVGYASASTGEVLRILRGWRGETLQQSCKTMSSVGYHSGLPATIDSNAGRELAYCAAHAVHHFAIIRLICNEVGIEVSKEFGYAPSTLKHQSLLAAD
ncbi:MAG TPA: hypothetical protein VL128_11165 [Candidatus Eisenbacteria bacterium]|nr:hypothetical protein [Candidatus Eisenbacteria bacterium]